MGSRDVWIGVDICGYMWICVDMCGYAWICVDMGGHVWYMWICVDICGYKWTCVEEDLKRIGDPSTDFRSVCVRLIFDRSFGLSLEVR